MPYDRCYGYLFKDATMITVEDILAEKDEKKESWPAKYSPNPLVVTYKELLNVLNDYSWLELNYCRSKEESEKLQLSKKMSIKYQSRRVLKALNNKNYIYLTPTRLHIPQSCMPARRNDDEYVAILKWEGRIGYCILILGFGKSYFGDLNPGETEYEKYDGYCGLMEVLSDGTTILFERTVSWDKVKACKANTTSIRNLFFTEDEIRLIGLKIDNIMNNPKSKPNKAYKCSIAEYVFYDKDKYIFHVDDIPF